MDTQTTTTLQIEGMTCSHCVGHVEKALSAVPGVLKASVDLEAKSARIDHEAGSVNAADLAAAVTEAGYPATAVEG